jgi:hypothetical protein
VVISITLLNFTTIVVLSENLTSGLDNLDKLQNDSITLYTNVATEIMAKKIQDTQGELLKINKIGYYSYYSWLNKYKAAASADPAHEYNKIRSGSTTDLFYDISFKCHDVTQVNFHTLTMPLLKSSTTEISRLNEIKETGFFYQKDGQLSQPDRVSLRNEFRLPLKMSRIAIDRMRSQFADTYNITRISMMFWKIDATPTPAKIYSAGMIYPGGCGTVKDFLDENQASVMHDLDKLKVANKLVLMEPYYNNFFNQWLSPFCMGYFDQAMQLRKLTTDQVVNVTICFEKQTNQYYNGIVQSATYTNMMKPHVYELQDSFIIALYKEKNMLNYHGNWTIKYNFTDINDPLFERWAGFNSLYTDSVFAPKLWPCPKRTDTSSGIFKHVTTYWHELTINKPYLMMVCSTEIDKKYELLKDISFAFYFPQKVIAIIKDDVTNAIWYSMVQITMGCVIFILILTSMITCMVYKEQLKITRSLNRLYEYTNDLKSSNDGDGNKTTPWDRESQSRFHTKDLVILFRNLLFRNADSSEQLNSIVRGEAKVYFFR